MPSLIYNCPCCNVDPWSRCFCWGKVPHISDRNKKYISHNSLFQVTISNVEKMTLAEGSPGVLCGPGAEADCECCQRIDCSAMSYLLYPTTCHGGFDIRCFNECTAYQQYGECSWASDLFKDGGHWYYIHLYVSTTLNGAGFTTESLVLQLRGARNDAQEANTPTFVWEDGIRWMACPMGSLAYNCVQRTQIFAPDFDDGCHTKAEFRYTSAAVLREKCDDGSFRNLDYDSDPPSTICNDQDINIINERVTSFPMNLEYADQLFVDDGDPLCGRFENICKYPEIITIQEILQDD